MTYLIPIIVGSDKDIEFAKHIQNHLKNFTLDSTIRVCSAHKSCVNLLKILKEYEDNENVKTYITIAGKSNALSALVDGNSVKPIISCPPVKDSNIHDIYSSISLPSGIAPLTVLGVENAALAATKIYALNDGILREKLLEYKADVI